MTRPSCRLRADELHTHAASGWSAHGGSSRSPPLGPRAAAVIIAPRKQDHGMRISSHLPPSSHRPTRPAVRQEMRTHCHRLSLRSRNRASCFDFTLFVSDLKRAEKVSRLSVAYTFTAQCSAPEPSRQRCSTSGSDQNLLVFPPRLVGPGNLHRMLHTVFSQVLVLVIRK